MSPPISKSDRVYVAGHRGLVGSAIVRQLKAQGYGDVLTATHRDLDLTDQGAVRAFFAREKPAAVIMCAARVGGIVANDRYPADFIADNLMIETNTIDAAWRNGVKKFVFMGTACIYPRDPARMPITEDLLLTGPLEQTNQWYAVAKIAGIKMAEAYRRQYGFDAVSVMPANLYGPGDNYDLEQSHVIPALIRKFHDAKVSGAGSVVVWGTGKPRREFLWVDDLAEATIFVMENYSAPELINIGSGEDISIGDLARRIAGIVGFDGRLEFDIARPDGVARRILDTTKLTKLGWRAKTGLDEGLRVAYRWFSDNVATARLGKPAAE
ncbi:MAG: bifunctional GDP-fucose synthetase: GDP-4-dehydro-6-deoxy-D-mannose epimerase [Pseudomonadota bacterium]|jgi:GDP-L-fucose synthase